MTEWLVSNLCVSLALALVACAFRKRPFVAHLLWLVVLLKLVTPPLMTIPVFAVSEVEPPVGDMTLERKPNAAS